MFFTHIQVHQIKGEKGGPGISIKGDKGEPGLSIKGDKGDKGEPGLDGKTVGLNILKVTSTTSWIVPAGVSRILIEAVSGGGGSGLGEGEKCAYGVTGGYSKESFSVSEGETLTIVVGAGGTKYSAKSIFATGDIGCEWSPSNQIHSYVREAPGGESFASNGTWKISGGTAGTGYGGIINLIGNPFVVYRYSYPNRDKPESITPEKYGLGGSSDFPENGHPGVVFIYY